MLGTIEDSLQELFHLVFMAMYEVDSDNIPILQIRLLKHREGKPLAQHHSPNKRQSEFELKPFVLKP